MSDERQRPQQGAHASTTPQGTLIHDGGEFRVSDDPEDIARAKYVHPRPDPKPAHQSAQVAGSLPLEPTYPDGTGAGVGADVLVIEDMPAAEYHAAEGLSSTQVRALLRSWADYDECGNVVENAAMRIGTAVHLLVLEPERAPGAVGVEPDVDRRTKDGKAAWAEWLRLADTYEVTLSDKPPRTGGPSDWERAQKCAASVSANPKAARALARAEHRELSVFWSDPETGVRCKARLDAYAAGYVCDVKTTGLGIDIASAQKWWGNRGGPIQIAWYGRAARAAGLAFNGGLVIASRTKAPFVAEVYEIDPSDLFDAEGLCMDAVAKFAAGRPEWCGYSPTGDDGEPVIQTLSVPPWAWAQYEGRG